MSRMSISTPCPAPASSRHPLSHLSLFSPTAGDDNATATIDIDFTRAAIQQGSRPARPRRPRPGGAKKEAAVAIFEDGDERKELVQQKRLSTAPEGRGALLGRPAQRGRIGGHSTKTAFGENVPEEKRRIASHESLGRERKRTSILSRQVEHGLPLEQSGKESLATCDIKKEPRRRTIFVPSDDTTMFTIHPGANSTTRIDDTFQLVPPATEYGGVSLRNTSVATSTQNNLLSRRPQLSLAAAPKRMPLQYLEVRDSNVPTTDVAGQNGGKENAPPNAVKAPAPDQPYEQMTKAAPISKVVGPTTALKARQEVFFKKAVPNTRATRAHGPDVAQQLTHGSRAVSRTDGHIHPSVSTRLKTTIRPDQPRKIIPSHARTVSRKPNVNFVNTSEVAKARVQQYPAIDENVLQAGMYEENWLSAQEVAFTEVINQIFAGAEVSRSSQADAGDESLRAGMMSLYQQDRVALMYQRIQSSLNYGSFSMPKNAGTSPSLLQDLGLRKRYLHLWLDSYELVFLRAAAEVVVGRRVVQPHSSPRGLKDSERVLDPHKERRGLIGFLETFFVSADDVACDIYRSDCLDDPASRRNRTLSRSLTMIWLLDQAKISGVIRGRLFRRKSMHKSSQSILQSLTAMLLPSLGDVSRILRYMDYEVGHVQDPLDDVEYRIENLAIDLRDGVMLTRLVEILQHSKHSETIDDAYSEAEDTAVTIILPDTTILESKACSSSNPYQLKVLSQHLKLPCLSRAQKLYNVQLALSSLACDPQMADDVPVSLAADDIVDGHREKTLDLLWSLLRKYGLERLIDRRELRSVTQRVQHFHGDQTPTAAPDNIEAELQTWAQAVCAKDGQSIPNLTTSFSDGRAYACIARAYSEYLIAPGSPRESKTKHLEAQLRALGWSPGFTSQLTDRQHSIPHRSTTLAILASLASRLLPLARNFHAATIIQRAYRRRCQRIVLKRRINLMRLTNDCAMVVMAQQKLEWAAMVLQKSWRCVLATRGRKLMSDVAGFQSMARGWASRRHLAGSGGKSETQSRRIMGGW